MRHETHPVTEDTDTPDTYEFHVGGPIGPLVRAALPELTASFVPAVTVLTGTMNHHADLQRLLDALAAHGSRGAELSITTHRAPPTVPPHR